MAVIFKIIIVIILTVPLVICCNVSEAVCPVNFSCQFSSVKCEYYCNNTISYNWTVISNYNQHCPIKSLNLSSNQISTLPIYAFSDLISLKELNLSLNNISTLPAKLFSGLTSLEKLYLNNNQIRTLTAKTFDDLTSLQILYLNKNSITTIKYGAFSYFTSSLLYLDLRNNNLQNYRDRTFEKLKKLKELYSDLFSLCCLVGDIDVCEPTDTFSSCADLLKREGLRVLMLVIGVSSAIGNGIVILSRRFNNKDNNKNDFNKVQTMLITNLAVSDLLMAVYLIIIASTDIHYRGRYAKVARDWKSSFLCSFAGAISTLSGQCSVTTLMILSIDRAVNIVNPFTTKWLNSTKCKIVIGISWLVWVVFSFLPLVNRLDFINLSYFCKNYYGKQSVCLALPLTRSRWPGWEYAIAIFIGFNGLSFIVIATSYVAIFVSVKRSGATVNKIKRRKDLTRRAWKLGIIVFTDFCCWFPVILMGICSETKRWDIPDEIYVWAASFIIPINSCINPYLYTIVHMFTCNSRKPNFQQEIKMTKVDI
ncbi:G-protein coupled receptor GRL101-like [Antedon mediterranea]|uniref:G-protein coupled receptor GRL101-like n=1 Tax=Antedon mediterranea TaxID=105859 RepID=UPI003AF82284